MTTPLRAIQNGHLCLMCGAQRSRPESACLQCREVTQTLPISLPVGGTIEPMWQGVPYRHQKPRVDLEFR